MDKKSQKIHRPGTGGYNWSVSDHPEGFQTYFSHLEGLSGTFPPISTSGKNHTKMITTIFRSDLYRFAKAIKSTDNRDSRLRNHQVIKKFFFKVLRSIWFVPPYTGQKNLIPQFYSYRKR